MNIFTIFVKSIIKLLKKIKKRTNKAKSPLILSYFCKLCLFWLFFRRKPQRTSDLKSNEQAARLGIEGAQPSCGSNKHVRTMVFFKNFFL